MYPRSDSTKSALANLFVKIVKTIEALDLLEFHLLLVPDKVVSYLCALLFTNALLELDFYINRREQSLFWTKFDARFLHL